MQPTKSQVHIDKALTDFSLAFMQNPGDFIAGIVPVKPVSKQTDKYFKYAPGDMARDGAKRRASGAESEGSGFAPSNDTYSCEKYALHVDLDEDTLANADAPLDLERDAIEFLAANMQIRKEKLFADAAWTTGIWGLDVLGASTHKFSDYTNSNPIQVIDEAKRVVRQKAYKTPNTLILGENVFLALKEHPDLVDRIKYTSQGILTEGVMASLFGVEKVVVAKAVINSANEGNADSMANLLGGKNALLCYLPASVGLMTASALTAFAWTGAAHLPRPNGVVSRRFDMPQIQGRRIETEICIDVKVTASALGCFLNDIVA
jgi:hypothetical protein